MVVDEPNFDVRVLVIVPAYNEARSIAGVVADLAARAPWADVVVVNDGSTDDTAAIAIRAGAKVLQLPFNLGIGGAMQTGYLYAAENGYDVAVQFDGDGQHRADQIAPLVKALRDHGADLVIGSRVIGRRSYRFQASRWLGSRLIGGVVRLVTGIRVGDPTSGFRAAGRRATRFFANHYPQTYLGDTAEALVWVARQGMTIREVPAEFRASDRSSITSLSGVWHTLRICLAILVDRIERRFHEAGDGDGS